MTDPTAVDDRTEAPLPFTRRELRDVMGQFATGVTVVTMLSADGPHGVTVNSFASVSLDPPLVMICLRNESRAAAVLRNTDVFAVNILGSTQADLGQTFASSARPSGWAGFAPIPYQLGKTGTPLLDGAAGYVECAMAQRFPMGDHTIFIGGVLGIGAAFGRSPLIYQRGRYRGTRRLESS